MKIIEAKQLVVGQTIRLGDGTFNKITNIGKGFVVGSLLIDWEGGWTCIPKAQKVRIK